MDVKGAKALSERLAEAACNVDHPPRKRWVVETRGEASAARSHDSEAGAKTNSAKQDRSRSYARAPRETRSLSSRAVLPVTGATRRKKKRPKKVKSKRPVAANEIGGPVELSNRPHFG